MINFNPIRDLLAATLNSLAEGTQGATPATQTAATQTPATQTPATPVAGTQFPAKQDPAQVTDQGPVPTKPKKRRVEYVPVKPQMQMGFIHNNMDCIGCRACEMACKDKNGLSAGPRFRRVQYIEGGVFPSVFAYKVNMSCNHCAEPACLPTCPTGALWKREKDGIVDIDSSLCVGCRRCEAACPYGAPQYDVESGVIKKCNMCVDELEAGRKPYCVAACMMRVLDVGPIDQLRAGTYQTKAMGPNDVPVDQVQGMADPALTNPSIVFIAHPKGKVQ